MASTQPSKKETSLFKEGTPRYLLIAEFGSPTYTETIQSEKMDIFTFTQGFSDGVKGARAVTHGVLDVITLGVWELAGTPLEGQFKGVEMSYRVTYDDNDKIQTIIRIK
jgi:hypothetical protein